MMVHHFLYFAPGRVDEAPGSCWSGAGFIGGRGEEHPIGSSASAGPARSATATASTTATADGSAPDWRLTAMVMNHYKRPKNFYVRTGSGTRPASGTSVSPMVIGKCSQRPQRHVLRRAGRRQEGLELRRQERLDRAVQRADPSAALAQPRRRQVPVAHELTCKRRLFKAPVVLRAGRTTSTTRSARSSTSPGRSATGAYAHPAGHPDREGRGAAAAWPCTTTTTCTWRRWASGPPGS